MKTLHRIMCPAGAALQRPPRLRRAARDPARFAMWAIHPKRRARRQPREPSRRPDLIGAAAPLSSFLNLLSVTDRATGRARRDRGQSPRAVNRPTLSWLSA